MCSCVLYCLQILMRSVKPKAIKTPFLHFPIFRFNAEKILPIASFPIESNCSDAVAITHSIIIPVTITISNSISLCGQAINANAGGAALGASGCCDDWMTHFAAPENCSMHYCLIGVQEQPNSPDSEFWQFWEHEWWNNFNSFPYCRWHRNLLCLVPGMAWPCSLLEWNFGLVSGSLPVTWLDIWISSCNNDIMNSCFAFAFACVVLCCVASEYRKTEWISTVHSMHAPHSHRTWLVFDLGLGTCMLYAEIGCVVSVIDEPLSTLWNWLMTPILYKNIIV